MENCCELFSAVPRFQVCGELLRSEPKSLLRLRSAEVTLESDPELCTDVRLPFSAVLHRPFVRSNDGGGGVWRCSRSSWLCCWAVIELVRLGTSGGTFLLLPLPLPPLPLPVLPLQLGVGVVLPPLGRI